MAECCKDPAIRRGCGCQAESEYARMLRTIGRFDPPYGDDDDGPDAA